MPTKVVEYMAHGVPVITTPLPLAVELVQNADCGFVVPFGDVRRLPTRSLRWTPTLTCASRWACAATTPLRAP